MNAPGKRRVYFDEVSIIVESLFIFFLDYFPSFSSLFSHRHFKGGSIGAAPSCRKKIFKYFSYHFRFKSFLTGYASFFPGNYRFQKLTL
jgi:hypothetical protein